MSKHRYHLALAFILLPLTAVPSFAQMPQGAPTGPTACPPGTVLVPPRQDSAGNLIAAYCAEDPRGPGAYDPYTGRNVSDPQAQPSEGGPGQYIPRTR
ncbi:MAG: hypothetical protein AB7T18_19210 [Alphaproteobacteria bacterium]